MQGLVRLQLAGPIALLVAVFGADSAAYALADAPSSAWLWYLNLEVFSIFRKSRTALSDICSLPFAQVILIAGPLACLACVGLALKRNLLTAVSSNLSFVYAAFVVYSWHHWHSFGTVKSASLAFAQVPTGTDLYLFIVMLLTSFASFAASHFLYFCAVRNET